MLEYDGLVTCAPLSFLTRHEVLLTVFYREYDGTHIDVDLIYFTLYSRALSVTRTIEWPVIKLLEHNATGGCTQGGGGTAAPQTPKNRNIKNTVFCRYDDIKPST
jgi:hypothetical protein